MIVLALISARSLNFCKMPRDDPAAPTLEHREGTCFWRGCARFTIRGKARLQLYKIGEARVYAGSS